MNWVNWWNNARLHQALDNATPAETETIYYQSQSATLALTQQEHNPGQFTPENN